MQKRIEHTRFLHMQKRLKQSGFVQVEKIVKHTLSEKKRTTNL